MTSEAQAALRRVIEKFTRNVRFCIICNQVNKALLRALLVAFIHLSIRVFARVLNFGNFGHADGLG